ncbi:MAG: hypothetical protein K5685_03825 [Bacteroidales bacterium]|nr:hypothetical protein [Bacteroidales bacterium]
MKKLLFIFFVLIVSCGQNPENVVNTDVLPSIFPDYKGVTIPVNIAPLNFNVDSAEYVLVDAKGSISGEILTKGEWADFDIDLWHELTQKNAGGKISVSVTAKKDGKWFGYKPFEIFISTDSLSEYGLTYRRIAPGYETFSNIGIFQRDIHTFDEFAIVDHTALQGECMNCHVANRCDPSRFQLHIRGQHAATLVQTNGKRKLLQTKTDSTIANCMYAYWHPSGRYCAYSLNLINQCFWEDTTRYIEVFDRASDALVLDMEKDEIILSPLLKTKDFESYPVFSADGKTIYYCTSKPYMDSGEITKMRYDLCAISFDEAARRIGDHADTIIHASKMGKSITHPRPSYDGKYLMYSMADYSVFPIHHPEADLYIMNLATGESRPLDEVNSKRAESFHNWSRNSRWFVFNSRRYNNTNNLLYIAHFGADGIAGKPFMLPQKNPREYYHKLIHSYNVPDFTAEKVDLDIRAFAREIFSDERIQVGVRRN